MISSASAGVVALFAFGFILMGLELLTSNLLSPYYGSSIYVWGSIIGVFMVYMSLGYVAGGALARRSGRLQPLLLALSAASLWILVLPLFHKTVGAAVSDAVEDVRLGSLLLTNLLMAAPTALMAMSSPYLIGLMQQEGPAARLTPGLVLFISTFGSFAGTIATSFYLIELFPVSRIIHGFGAAGLLICGVLWLATRRRDADAETDTYSP